MLAGGLNGLILPLRGGIENFSAVSLGLLGTGWAVGYVSGCLAAPRFVRSVGHIRSFGVMAALAAVSVLLSLLIIHPLAWVPLRSVAGFAFAGAAMIVESWLNERADPQYRGRIFGVYTMVNLFMTMAGQMMITLGNAAGYMFFVLAAIFYCLSLIPTALSTTAAPAPLVQASLDLKALFRNSPIAVVGVFLVGISNSAFGTLGAVFAQRLDMNLTGIAIFMSLSLLAGALFQFPVGWLSDKMDRRLVLIALAALAASVDVFIIWVEPSALLYIVAASALFGGAIYAMYPVIVAHANDHASEGGFLKISGGLLLLYGCGAIVGPLIAGGMMAAFGPSGLFITTLFVHIAIALYAGYRMTQRSSLTEGEKEDFVSMPTARYATPETGTLDPRTETDEI